MRQISGSTTKLSCVGGLNSYDPLSAMNPADAIILRDVWPSSYGCSIRKGSRLHADGLNGEVNTLLAWKSSTGEYKNFAVDSDGIYDITTFGTVSGTPDVPVTSSWLQHTTLGNAAGTHLIAFNGVDDGFWYSAVSGWLRLTAGDGTIEGTWSGVDPADLIQCTVHQKRLWAVEKDTTRAWYLPPDQIYGIAKSFDFGANFTSGGYLQALCTWTHDGGEGMDDYLLAISSSGQIAVYQGIDVDGAPDTWQLTGVYYIGPTFTRRCWAKYGSDVVFLTLYGVVTMNGILRTHDGSVLSTALSKKIQTLMSDLTSEGSTRSGWQIIVYSPANMVLINVPGFVTSQNVQIALNTITGAWTVFSNIPSACWGRDIDTLFLGREGSVYRFWEGYVDYADYDNLNGEFIVGVIQQAFTDLGAPGVIKHFKMIRPTFITTQPIRYNVALNIDYRFDSVLGSGNFGVYTADSIWDSADALWDEASWSGGSNVVNDWVSVVGMGNVCSVTMRLEASSEVTWTSTDFIMESGGPI